MKRHIQKLRLCLLLCLTAVMLLPTTTAQANTMSSEVEKWATVNIDSLAPSTITAQAINDWLEANGASEKAKSEDVGGAIMESANANGINPALMFAMFLHETGRGGDWKWTEANNPGGIRCKTGYPCEKSCDTCALWTKFETVKQGFQVKGEILRGYIEDRGVKTIQQMLEIYAPPSDNNDLYSDDGYIAMIGRNISYLGATADQFTGTATAKGGNYSDGTAVGSWKKKNFFMTSTYSSEVAVIDKGEEIPSILSYAFTRFAGKATKWMTIGGTVISLLLLLYISLTIISYTLIVKGKASAGGLFSKMILIKGNVYETGALKQVAIQAFLVIFIICMFLSKLYLNLMGLVYTGWELLLSLF